MNSKYDLLKELGRARDAATMAAADCPHWDYADDEDPQWSCCLALHEAEQKVRSIEKRIRAIQEKQP